jgi:hypothetical protein
MLTGAGGDGAEKPSVLLDSAAARTAFSPLAEEATLALSIVLVKKKSKVKYNNKDEGIISDADDLYGQGRGEAGYTRLDTRWGFIPTTNFYQNGL